MFDMIPPEIPVIHASLFYLMEYQKQSQLDATFAISVPAGSPGTRGTGNCEFTRRNAMSGKAARILVSEKQHEELLKITNARTASQRLIQRARIILLDFITCFNNTFARPFIWNYNGRHVKTHSIKRPNSLHR